MGLANDRVDLLEHREIGEEAVHGARLHLARLPVLGADAREEAAPKIVEALGVLAEPLDAPHLHWIGVRPDA